MLSGEYKDFLTQNKYCSPIYPSNSELKRMEIPCPNGSKLILGQSA